MDTGIPGSISLQTPHSACCCTTCVTALSLESSAFCHHSFYICFSRLASGLSYTNPTYIHPSEAGCARLGMGEQGRVCQALHKYYIHILFRKPQPCYRSVQSKSISQESITPHATHSHRTSTYHSREVCSQEAKDAVSY